MASGLAAAAVPAFSRFAKADTGRAANLVRENRVIDMLGLLTLDWKRLDHWQSAPENFSEADFQRLRSSGIDVFHPAVAFESDQSHQITRQWFAKWNNFINAHPRYFYRIDNSADLARAIQEQRIGIVLGMQDANHLRSLDDLDLFYGMGQRLTQLTYNSTNRLGSGCMASDRGLTPFGIDVVSKMNKIGMAIDVSHCGPKTTLDAIEASSKPVLITHSNCRTLAPGVARCKTDDIILAAAKKGGVIGITGVRKFVRNTDPVTAENVLDHFDYAVKLAGIEHVGLGSDTDLDGRAPYTAGLNSVDRVYALTEGLVRRGYTGDQIAMLLGGNFERALNAIWN